MSKTYRIDPPNKDTILSSLIKPETFTSEQAMSKSNETKRMGFRISITKCKGSSESTILTGGQQRQKMELNWQSMHLVRR